MEVGFSTPRRAKQQSGNAKPQLGIALIFIAELGLGVPGWASSLGYPCEYGRD